MWANILLVQGRKNLRIAANNAKKSTTGRHFIQNAVISVNLPASGLLLNLTCAVHSSSPIHLHQISLTHIALIVGEMRNNRSKLTRELAEHANAFKIKYVCAVKRPGLPLSSSDIVLWEWTTTDTAHHVQALLDAVCLQISDSVAQRVSSSLRSRVNIVTTWFSLRNSYVHWCWCDRDKWLHHQLNNI